MYHADPLVCRQCGGKLKVVAYVSDEITVKRILTVLGLSPPVDEKPPPIREVVRVPVDDEGREIQIQSRAARTAPSILTLVPPRG